MKNFATPGAALKALSEKEGWTLEDLADRLAFTPYLTRKLLSDEIPVTAVVASQLEVATGKPVSQWMGLYAKAEQAKTPIGKSLSL